MNRFFEPLCALLLAAVCCTAFAPSLYAQKYTVYAALYKENNLAIVNPQSGKIIQRIQVGRGPDCIVLNPDETKLFVSNTGELTVSIVDIAGTRVSQVLRLPANRRNIYAGTMTATPDRKKIFVAERAEKPELLRVYVIDPATEMIVHQFDVADNINSMAVSNDGKRLFIVEKGKAVHVYDTETYTKIGAVPCIKGQEANVNCVSASPTEGVGILTYGTANKIQLFDAEKLTTIATIDAPKYKTGDQKDAFFAGNGKYAFIINRKNLLSDVEGILVLEVAKKEIIKIFNSGAVQRGMAMTPDNNTFYVAADDLKWYNLLTLEHIRSVSLRTEVRGIVILPEQTM